MDDTHYEDDDTVLMEARPNAFLYALEGTRAMFIIAPVMGLAVPLTHMQAFHQAGLKFTIFLYTHVFPILCLVGYLLVFAYALFIGLQTRFEITRSHVVIYREYIIFGAKALVAIPIKSISRIETRCYNEKYGSVYFQSDASSGPNATTDGAVVTRAPLERSEFGKRGRSALLTSAKARSPFERINRGSAWIWASFPVSQPRLAGFWGFEDFRNFADLIVQLKGNF